MKHLRYQLFIILSLLSAVITQAATFTVVPPRRVLKGEKFAVTFRIDNGSGEGLQVSQINGCELIYGPSVTKSQSYQIVNGAVSGGERVEYTYTYRADRAGTFTIPAASVVVNGKKMTTRPTQFTVQDAGSASSSAASASSRPVTMGDIDTQSSSRPVNSSDVFVRIILSRTSVYEQEAIECTIKLYTKYNISKFLPTKQPSFDGFLIEEVPIQSAINRQENYNGQTYATAILKQCIIFPQKSGKLTINSGNYDLSVVQYDRLNMNGMITINQPRERSIQVTSNTASVDVKALPQPQPAGFSGAVGTFSVNSRLVGNRFLTNDPASLIYTITGTGNIKFVKEPTIDFPSEFETYTPKTDIKAHVTGPTMAGSMTIDYTFVPQSVGEFTIGGDTFVYFDPVKTQYVTLTTPSYKVNVGKGSDTASRDQERIAVKNTDILHIKPGVSNLSHSHTLVINSWWYWLLWILPLAALVAVSVGRSRNLRLNADVTRSRLVKANKVARKRLSAAEAFMKAGKSDEFYSEILRAFTGYLSDKLSLPVSQLSRDSIDNALEQAGASAELRAQAAELLDRCEMARYTPDASQHTEQVYSSITDVINHIENLKRS